MDIGVGTVLGQRWELIGFLASGGMAEVFRGRDTTTDAIVAVKVLRAGVEEGERRFASEVATLRRLKHPNVVRIVDAGQHGEVPWLVMELVRGPTLTRVLDHGRLDHEHVRRMGLQMARALAYAHGLGVINRDVKPSNVLFEADGHVKLADFGVALLIEGSRITTSGVAVGTAGFIAPEQMMEQEVVGPPADVYSLGLLLLECLTGERAFSGPPTEAALMRLTRDPVIPEDLSEPWRDLLWAMTAREPGARPAAEIVARRLETEIPETPTGPLELPRTEDDDTVLFSASSVGVERTTLPPGQADVPTQLHDQVGPAARSAEPPGFTDR